MSVHKMVNGKCTLCGCRSWEQAKPCSKEMRQLAGALLKERRNRKRRERESQSSKHCDEGWMNDFRFGEGPDY